RPVAVMQVLHVEEVAPDQEPQREAEFARRQVAIRGEGYAGGRVLRGDSRSSSWLPVTYLPNVRDSTYIVAQQGTCETKRDRATMARLRHAERDQIPATGTRGAAQRYGADADAARLPASARARRGHQGGLRRRRLRRLHRGPAQTRQRRTHLPAGELLHPPRRPGRRRRSHHGR